MSRTAGSVGGAPYGFVGLERVGCVMAWNASHRADLVLVACFDGSFFFAAADGPDVGDRGPEPVVFVAADTVPVGAPLLIVASEIGAPTRVYEIATN